MEKRLQNLLKNEYGEVYDEEERTIKEAKKIIAKRNPELASCTPKEAKEVLKVQLDGFLHSRALFNKSLESTQTLRDWWMNIGCQAQKDGNVLAALAVKLYSVCPTSMVDEQQMSVISWLNSPKGNGQWVATIQNLAIIHSVHMLQTKSQQKCPMTVSWCDIKEVIGWHATTATPAAKVIDITSDDSGTNSEDEDGEDNDVDLLIEDSDKSAMDNMKWVDELAQPAPSTANGSSFDVEEDMDLAGFHYILADEHPKEPSVEGKSTEKRKDGSQEGKGKEKMSATVATEAVDWDAE
uniref:HAT C-terminal dimerisation domain-containing protein n=1 Tax=Moniliophthora roreri TaxID=221103 RepID=A0A0W0F9T0_MONRR